MSLIPMVGMIGVFKRSVLVFRIELQVSKIGLPTRLPEMIQELVSEDPGQPGPFRGPPLISFNPPQSGEQGFLHEILGLGGIPKT